MKNLIKALAKDYGELKFKPGKIFSWSPIGSVVTYPLNQKDSRLGSWSLLHEVSHALLSHNTYASDLELLVMEAEAWHKAKQLGNKFDVKIDEEHMQDCLDTYRDWLHKRSACPRCNARGLQEDNYSYNCFNCFMTWSVTPARFCRPYRINARKITAPA